MPALDGLRALAVLAVIAFHAGAVPGGWLGVEVFFVLSGYLITSLALEEIDRTGVVGLRAFWGRRVRRLWPAICAYLLVTLVVIAPRVVSVTPPARRHLLATLTWHQNWQMISDGGYGAGLRSGVVEHFWSLSIEEQFYLVWPVALWAIARCIGRRGVRVLAVLGGVASLVVMFWGLRHGWSTDRLYLGSDTRVIGLCVGAAFAGLRPTGRVAAFASGLGVAAIVIACGQFGAIRHDILAGPLQVFTAVSAIAVVCSAGLRRGPLVWRPVRAIGRWSFGIYLWHVPIGMIVGSRVASAWVVAVVTASLASVVGALSYRLVETPVRQRGTAGRLVAVGLTATAVLVAAIGVVEVQPEFASAEVSVSTTAVTAVATTVATGAATTVTSPPEPPTLVIVGDSVPRRATSEIVAAGASAGWNVTIDARDACAMSSNPRDQFLTDCAQWVDRLDTSVVGADAVVMWWGGTGEFFLWHSRSVKACDAPEQVIDRYETFLESLDIPPGTPLALALPSERADLGARENASTKCERTAIIDWAASRNLVVFDPDPARLAAGGEREVRVDGMHYTHLGAVAVSEAFFATLASAWDR